MRTLFWNLNGRPLIPMIADLVSEHDVDLLVLAEAEEIHDGKLVKAMSQRSGATFVFHYSPGADRCRFYSRFPITSVHPLIDSGGISVRSVKAPRCKPIIVAGVHSPSRLYWDSWGDRFTLARQIREKLEQAEDGQKHRRSIVVGDLNSDPFEEAITNSDGLHAVSARSIAKRTSRQVAGEKRHFLYNPMWSLLGDLSAGPPGSYYYRRATSSCRFWHMFDQVLLRPELIDSFLPSELRLLTSVAGTTLTGDGSEPDSSVASDHFPLVFELDLLGRFADV